MPGLIYLDILTYVLCLLGNKNLQIDTGLSLDNKLDAYFRLLQN